MGANVGNADRCGNRGHGPLLHRTGIAGMARSYAGVSRGRFLLPRQNKRSQHRQC
jgi:hypothetical protein